MVKEFLIEIYLDIGFSLSCSQTYRLCSNNDGTIAIGCVPKD